MPRRGRPRPRRTILAAVRRVLLPMALGSLGLWAGAAGPSVRDAHAEPRPGALAISLPFERLTLENGLEVILQEDHTTPTVALDLCYSAGSKDDPPAHKGLADVVARLLSEPSTRHVDRGHLADLFRTLGAPKIVPSVVPTLDRIHMRAAVPANELELALWLYSDWMGFFLDGVSLKVIAQAKLANSVARASLEERTGYGAMDGLMHRALYPAGHPYASPYLGTTEGVADIGRAEVAAFARAYLIPNNASLALVGNFDRGQAKAWVTRYFGPIVRGASVPKTEVRRASPAGERRLRAMTGMSRARLYVSWPSPAYFAPGDEVLDVLARALTFGSQSILHRAFVDGGLAEGVWSKQQSHKLGGEFEIVITLGAGKTPEQALAKLDETLASLRAGVPAADVERAKQVMLRQMVLEEETPASRAAQASTMFVHAGDPGKIQPWIAAYEAVTPAAVQAIVRDVLTPGSRVVALVASDPGSPPGGVLVGGP
jgi:zinc protease